MNTYISNRLKKALRLGVISFLFPLSSSLITSCEDVPMPFNNPELPPEPDVVVIDPNKGESIQRSRSSCLHQHIRS